jgi:hypothetical protein
MLKNNKGKVIKRNIKRIKMTKILKINKNMNKEFYKITRKRLYKV